MSLTARCISSYPKRGKDNIVRKMFVFQVTGSKEELEQYVALQSKRVPGAKWIDEDGNVFYWTSAPSGQTITLGITTNGNVFEDTTMIDLKAAGSARYDHTYDSVRAGLAGTGAGIPSRQQPEPAEKQPAGSETPIDQE